MKAGAGAVLPLDKHGFKQGSLLILSFYADHSEPGARACSKLQARRRWPERAVPFPVDKTGKILGSYSGCRLHQPFNRLVNAERMPKHSSRSMNTYFPRG